MFPPGQLLVNKEVISASTLDAVLAEQSASAEPLSLARCWWTKVSPLRQKSAMRWSRQKEIAQLHAAVPTMRVDAAKLDDLINLIGRARCSSGNRLLQLSRDSSSGKLAINELSSSLAQSSARLSFITGRIAVGGPEDPHWFPSRLSFAGSLVWFAT